MKCDVLGKGFATNQSTKTKPQRMHTQPRIFCYNKLEISGDNKPIKFLLIKTGNHIVKLNTENSSLFRLII